MDIDDLKLLEMLNEWERQNGGRVGFYGYIGDITGDHPEKVRSRIRRLLGTHTRAPVDDVEFIEDDPDETRQALSLNGVKSALIIGDLHAPFEHRKYLDFVRRVRDRFRCDAIISIGDLVDAHSVSAHQHDPDGYSPSHEFTMAKRHLAPWYREFERADVLWGNHDLRVQRAILGAGIPRMFLRSFEEVMGFPDGWRMHQRVILNDSVLIEHGGAHGGEFAAVNTAKRYMKSVVIGHIHSAAGVWYVHGADSVIFGMNVGTGIDESRYAFSYKKSAKRCALGCGVLLDGGALPLYVPMPEA